MITPLMRQDSYDGATRVEGSPGVLSFGLTARRSGWAPRREQFTNLLLSGLQDVLIEAGHNLIFRVVADEAEEQAVRSYWARTGLVDAFVVHDVEAAEHLEPLREVGLPFVLLGDASQRSWHDATVTADDAALMGDVLEHLAGLGHRRIVWVCGPVQRAHIAARRAVFDAFVAEHGLESAVYPGDYGEEHIAGALDSELARGNGPRALVMDGDYIAATAQARFAEAGLTPPELAILVWQDSRRCQSARPPLSALNHHVDELGRVLGRALIAVAQGEGEVHLDAPAAELYVRQTTRPLPRARAEGDAPQR